MYFQVVIVVVVVVVQVSFKGKKFSLDTFWLQLLFYILTVTTIKRQSKYPFLYLFVQDVSLWMIMVNLIDNDFYSNPVQSKSFALLLDSIIKTFHCLESFSEMYCQKKMCFLAICFLRGLLSVMVINAGNWIGHLSTNLRFGCLWFTSCQCDLEKHKPFSSPPNYE